MVEPPLRGGASRRTLRPVAELLAALTFLTRLPIPFTRTLDLPPMAVAMRMFPVAGALIGCLSALVLMLTKYAGLPALLAAAVTLAATAMLTGALHEDGLADVADGFGGGRSIEDRLAIMDDSRIGAYGTIALMLMFLARAAVLEQLYYLEPMTMAVALAAAAGFSRALIVDLMWATRPARSSGLSASVGRPSRRDALIALLVGGVGAFIAVSFAISPERAIIAIIAGGVALAAMRALAMRKIGGQTGDVCGATQVLTEIAMLSVLAASFG
jgi:adenosylcobinamide-GDP ribazoletransferase